MREITLLERSGPLVLAACMVLPSPLTPAMIVVGGPCTLGDAISSANTDSAVGGCTAGAGADTLRLTGDLTLASGPPPVTTQIRVEGGGFTVSRDGGAPEFRFFDVEGPGDLELADLTLTGGKVSGVLNGGGAIRNRGTLTVEGATITGNEASFSGGGLFNDGLATLINSTLSFNSTGDVGGGIYSEFGAVTTVVDSEVTNNYSSFAGSGLFAYEGDYPDRGITITGSTIADNQHSGVVIFYPFSDNALTIENSTISGNGEDGLYVLGGFGIEVANTTFAGNGDNAIDGYTESGDGRFSNNLFAYSGAADCSFAAFDDGGGNFDTDGSCGSALPLTGLDPALADNGGPTRTHALLAGSSAIDGGGDCGLLVDQRGFGRDASCDSGAFEFDGAPAIASSVGGVLPGRVTCVNQTAGGFVNLFGVTSWNCRSAGLAIESGDSVRQTVRARPASPRFTGSVEGISSAQVRCHNLATDQSVHFFLPGGAGDFDCRERGLDFSPGDPVTWGVVGIAE